MLPLLGRPRMLSAAWSMVPPIRLTSDEPLLAWKNAFIS
jgi:hypothetical protein